MTTNKILTAKDLSTITGFSIRTCETYLSEMLSYYKPKSNKITMEHYYDYFAIPKKDGKEKNICL